MLPMITINNYFDYMLTIVFKKFSSKIMIALTESPKKKQMKENIVNSL